METSKIWRVASWKVLANNRRVWLGSAHFSKRSEAVTAYEDFSKPKGVRAPVRVVFTSADLWADGTIVYTMYVDECQIREMP